MSLLAFAPVIASGLALYSEADGAGIEGLDNFFFTLGKTLAKIELKAHRHDGDALNDMVETARSLVPVDTGLLLNGIVGEEIDGHFEFRASAVRTSASGKAQEDYAHFVEFGTSGGERGQAYQSVDEGSILHDLYGASAGSAFATRRRGRKSARSHPGTEAQPFFYPAAEQALAKRGVALDDAIDQSVAEDWN